MAFDCIAVMMVKPRSRSTVMLITIRSCHYFVFVVFDSGLGLALGLGLRLGPACYVLAVAERLFEFHALARTSSYYKYALFTCLK